MDTFVKWDQELEDAKASYFHEIVLDVDKHILERAYLNFMEVVENVGGFYDGLYLLLNIFIAPLAATFYEQDFVKGFKKEPTMSYK